MRVKQKLGTGLALSVLLAGISFMAHAKVDGVGALDVLHSAAIDTVYPVQQNVGDGKLQVAARTGMRRRSFRFRGNRVSRPISRSSRSNSVSRTGISRRSARFSGRRGVGRSAAVTVNARSVTGSRHRVFRFRGRHGRR